MEWYRKAAENGLPIAQYALGVSYDAEDGFEKDYKQSF